MQKIKKLKLAIFLHPKSISGRELKAETFEILLFETQLKFDLPKSYVDTASTGFLGHNKDQRPFVNTVTKQKYIGKDEGDHLGYYFLQYYSCKWPFYERRFFCTPHAELLFNLTGISVTKSQESEYSNVMLKEIGAAWLKAHYSNTASQMNEFYLNKHDNGLIELVENEKHEKSIQKNIFNIEHLNISNQPAFKAKIAPNIIHYWLPFSSSDFLKFSFTIISLKKIEEPIKANTIQNSEAIINKIISTIQLIFKDQLKIRQESP